MTWDDLRWVLAVAEAGGTEAAAAALGASRATVYRRLSAIESHAGPLFERHPSGWTPTARGVRVVETARAVAAQVRSLDADLAVRDGDLTGAVSLTVVAAMGPLLPPILLDFRRRWPGLRVDLVVDDAALSLPRREADVALRVVGAPPPSLIGRRLAMVASATYAAPDLPADADWVLFDGPPGSPVSRWQEAHVPAGRVALRTNSRPTFLALLRAGAGRGVAPCGLGDPDPALVRVGPVLPELAVPLWILWPEALRAAPRVRALADHLVAAVGAQRARIEGRSPRG